MRALVRAAMVVMLAGPAAAQKPSFVLLEPEPDLPMEEVSVPADSAFAIAKNYGMDAELRQVAIKLGRDDDHGLHWTVMYVGRASVRGTCGFYIDATNGRVVDRQAVYSSEGKERYDFVQDVAAAKTDSCPPATPRVRFAGARRRHYPQRECLLRIDVEDARRGIIEAYLLDLSDDRTPREDMGVVIEQLGGARPLPADWRPQQPIYPLIKFHPDSLMVFITWDDGNDDIQEPVSSRFAVYAIDAASNRSAEPDTLVVELPGGWISSR